MSRSSALVVVCALVLSAQAAWAAERIFTLKNGRRVQGELLDEDRGHYTVKTTGGTIKLDRSLVVKVEDVPPPSEFLKPDAVKKPGDSAKTPDASTPRRTGKQQLQDESWENETYTGKKTAYTGASADEVAKCRAALKRIGGAPAETHSGLLDDLYERMGPGPIVTIAAEFIEQGPPPDERALAIQCLSRAGARARPEMTKAIVVTGGAATDILPLLEAVFDDSVEDALVKALPNMGYPQYPVVEILGRKGTRRSADTFCAMVATVSDELDHRLPRVLGEALAAIMARDDHADDIARNLAGRVDVEKLPTGRRIQAILVALAAAPEAGVPKLLRILDKVEEEKRDARKDFDVFMSRQRVEFVYRALATTGAEEGLARIERAVDGEDDENVRVQWLKCLMVAKRSGANADLVGWLVARWAAGHEAELVNSILATITGKGFGRNLAAWQSYAAELKRGR